MQASSGKPVQHRRGSSVILTLAVLLAAASWPGDLPALESKTPNIAETLSVVIRGDQLPQLEGIEAGRLSAFTCRGGRPEPVVFQFDERDSSGRFVDNAISAQNGDDSPGLLDANDELAFMLSDLGEACPTEILSRASEDAYEIQASRPSLRKPGYVYLLEGKPAAAPAHSLIRYTPANHTMMSDVFAVGFDANNPVLIDKFALAEYRPRPRADVLDRIKLRFTGRALRNLVSLSMDESEIDGELLATRTGPIRAIREIEVSIQPVPGFQIMGSATFILYRRHAEVSFILDVPKAGALFVSSMDMEVGMDFVDLRGTRVSTNSLPEGVLVDGAMIEQENNLSLGKEPWFFISGNGINMLGYVDPDPKMGVTAAANFLDSETAFEPPESVPGALPKIGYFFENWENVKAGSYRFFAYYGVLPGFPEGGGSGFYKVTHEPNQIRVRPIEHSDLPEKSNAQN